MFTNRSRMTTTIWATLLLTGGFGLWLILPDGIRDAVEPTAHAATFTVNTADDHNDGVCNTADCTLREAINAASAGDTISFNIPGAGVHTINATGGFSITKAVNIDGSTQPGYAGAPLIEINGAGAGAGVNGLSVNAPNVIIKGLIINRFSGYGINFDSFGNSSVQGCYVGTNATGTAASANGAGGIRINASGITIGGSTAASRNVISGNALTPDIADEPRPEVVAATGGVVIVGGMGSQIVGNFIGTRADGTVLPTVTLYQPAGVIIADAANNIVGGTTVAARNIISGNLEGVKLTGAQAMNNLVQGNFVGKNLFDGVTISDGASNNTIGGTLVGSGNTIAANGNDIEFHSIAGVAVIAGTGNAILGNSIFSNAHNPALIGSAGGLGIDLGPSDVTPNDSCDCDEGPNNLQNFPVITSATANSTTATIHGTLNSSPNTQFRIEFFANDGCDNGVGQTFLGFTNATTDASCNASFTFSVPNGAVTGPLITATATDSGNNTSEFSACVTLVGLFPTIQFNSASYTIGEGDKRVDTIITRLGDNTASASVSFTTNDSAFAQRCNVTNGVASSRCDYEERVATVKFAPGETSKTISVFIIDDSYLEGPETFTVNLFSAVGAFLGDNALATVTITDNDLANGPNLIDMPGSFVRTQYLDFLNREPDQSGFDFWTNQIISCGLDQACIQQRRINDSAAFFLSVEFQQTGYLVERIYKAAFGDVIVESALGGSHQLAVPFVKINDFLQGTQQIGAGVIVGQSGWETVLENNKRAFALDFVQGSRFLDRYPAGMTPAQFVDRLFANSGFTPSATDRNAAIAEFGSATNISEAAARARALLEVAENATLVNQEFNRAFVLMEYFGYLRREPNDLLDPGYSGYDFWLTKLNQFNGDFQKAEMVKAFITSGEYRSRFGQP